MITKNCECCNKEIKVRLNKTRFCSKVCAGKVVNKKNRTGKIVNCNTCNKEIYRAKWEMKERNYCSNECKNKSFVVERIELKCSWEQCNNTLHRTQTAIDNGNGNFFCSAQCASKNGLKTIQQNPPKNRRTKPEMEFKKLLEKLEINCIFQYPLQWKRGWKKWYDFYLPDYNTLVEVDGTYWHGKGVTELNEQQQQTRDNDILKNKLAKEQGYNLLRIWSDEINEFNINKLKGFKNGR